ncbi:DUF262 domain-containing HNH endonuclease family protein [Sporosarcina sp. GW1-11]|uniref:DUF262 domain-containing protein n=1 Tax=Sporosarcina sp. GW1-11 TaxID=2899126 RepID=UPI00294F9F66|nr:DUF262 domain-containing HNH endonuclease family protein [Sporosarcina sp. GW1-11]MDV6378870.1 DUF262 domain-containing HNH endonuclease family protein [Sporosarcina sp. GW1-11]
MDAGTILLLEFLNKQKTVFRVPVYQRNYEWTEEQVNQYFYDIERIVTEDGYKGHFLGTVVFVKSSFPGMGTDLIIIDGQQRITTTFLFLKAIHDTLGKDHRYTSEINDMYFENRNVDAAYVSKLIPVQEDRNAYNELLTHDLSDMNSKIHKNYKHLMYLLQHSNSSTEEMYEALMKVKIVYIELEQGRKDENPQVIFESLNSTGLALTQSDLIRNYLLMNEPPESQEIMYRNYWLPIEKQLTNAKISDFIRDFITMKTGNIPNKSKVYHQFKIYVTTNQFRSKEILEQLYKYSKFYKLFLRQDAPEKEVAHYLKIYNQMQSTVAFPYLLQIFDMYYNEKLILQEEFLEVLKVISSYLIRRLVCNLPTNALNKVFASMGKEVTKRHNDNGIVVAVEDYLMSRKGSAVFPRDEKFRDSFINGDIYQRKSRLAVILLSNIESRGHKELVDMENITVEHIMPQSLSPSWKIELGKNSNEVHIILKDTIGNLTLTNYNSELSNRDFEKKKFFYSQSNIKITRDISAFDKWNKDNILKRGEILFKTALLIWSLPEDRYNTSKLDTFGGDAYVNIIDPIIVTGKKPTHLKIEERSFNAETWKAVLLNFLKYLADKDLEGYLDLAKQRQFQKLLSYNETFFRKGERVEGLYVETNLDAQTIFNYIGLLAEYYDIEDLIEVKITN